MLPSPLFLHIFRTRWDWFFLLQPSVVHLAALYPEASPSNGKRMESVYLAALPMSFSGKPGCVFLCVTGGGCTSVPFAALDSDGPGEQCGEGAHWN